MACESCGKPKCACGKDGCSSGAAVVIKNATEYVNFRKVEIPASAGDETTLPPKPGAFCNALVEYKATGAVYMYSSDKMPTRIDGLGATKEIWDAIHNEEDERKDADDEIWTEIETIEAGSDVVDVVGTYAELQSYDTSKLHANDLIKVLQDETRDDAITYYRWSGTAFNYVGAEGPYYTASETDTLLAGKQNTLTAGANITISDNTISATDTTYTHFTGATASTDGVQGLVPGPLAGDENKVLKGDGTWGTVQGGSTQTIFYMNASETGSTRHLYEASDMTGLVTMQDIIDANEDGQVIVRISTSVTPSMYSDMYLQNAYVATGDYQMIFLDNQYYYSFDATQTSANTFQFAKSEVQRKLTAGSNIQINGNTISATDTTYSDFTGATALADGAAGLVPAPLTGDEDKYLKGDGTWGTVQSGSTVSIFYADSADFYGTTGNQFSIYSNDTLTTAITGQTFEDAYNNGGVQIRVYDTNLDRWDTYNVIGDMYDPDEEDYDTYTLVNGGIEAGAGTDGPTIYALRANGYLSTNFFISNKYDLQQGLTAGTNISITGTTISATDTTYSDFGGATSSVAGSAGLVPAPTTSDPDKFLKGDGTWSTLPAANNISSNDWSGLWQ